MYCIICSKGSVCNRFPSLSSLHGFQNALSLKHIEKTQCRAKAVFGIWPELRLCMLDDYLLLDQLHFMLMIVVNAAMHACIISNYLYNQ